MANPNPPCKFPKGNKFGGRKPMTQEARNIRHLSHEEMIKMVARVREYRVKNLKELKQTEMTLGEKVILKAYIDNDYRGIEYYENRLWGKVRESIDLQLPEGIKIVFENMTGDERDQV